MHQGPQSKVLSAARLTLGSRKEALRLGTMKSLDISDTLLQRQGYKGRDVSARIQRQGYTEKQGCRDKDTEATILRKEVV